MGREIQFDHETGWVVVPSLLSVEAAADLAAQCVDLADRLDAPMSGDKPRGLTRRLTALDTRIPATGTIVSALAPVVDQILGDDWTTTEVAFRSPAPGTGHQDLHADDPPRLDLTVPTRVATAVVALSTFSRSTGATRLVPGSHLRPDVQRLSQRIRHHDDERWIEGPPGTAIVFNGHVLHGGSVNTSAEARPALQVSFRSS